MSKVLLIIGLAILLVIGGVVAIRYMTPAPTAPAKTPNTILIGFALGTLREDRWRTDLDLFTKKVESLGASVSSLSNDYDVPTQISQIDNLVNQGAKVIVVVPADSDKIAPAIEKAHEAGVKIIAYDRLINNATVDLYTSFDNVKVGVLEASGVTSVVSKGKFAYIGGSPADNNAFLLKQGSMSVLDPKIKSGDIKLVVDEFTPDWKPETAYQNLKKYLDTGGALDAVVAANDGTAFGVIQALTEKGLAGKVPVSGQDAELSACQRIVAGTQTLTIYKPIKALAEKTAELAVAMAKGQAPETTGVINNGKMDVPSYLLEPIPVTKANMMETIVKDGFHTAQEVYGTSTAQ
ncbi:MAG TPA: substrate-binding domain-containing protein [Candidatus Paceibacterota bacterium]|nr:substrate-binding domain-containing protein [Candidatus Paceibacterota bacterium]